VARFEFGRELALPKTGHIMKTKTSLQKQIAIVAPWISISYFWDYDDDCGPISQDCDGFTPEQDDEWQAWQSNVKAVAIIKGDEVEGNAYLGGIWEKVGDVPEESNPDISGYEAQMTVEALEELDTLIVKSGESEANLLVQIAAAVKVCKVHMQASYKAQQTQNA